MKSTHEMMSAITHDDLRQWAGDTIYSRGRRYISQVSELSQTKDGYVAAWVSGSDEYATAVRYDGDGKFVYDCTCPYDWGPCKHAVAVLLSAAELIKKGREIPLLDPEDELYLELFEIFDEEDEEGGLAEIESMLSTKTHEELLAMIMDLAVFVPAVTERLRDAALQETGQIDTLVRSLRREIRSVTAEEAWYNSWKDEGNLPDYSHVKEQLKNLLDNGHVDKVLELGEELWHLCLKQVEQSDDEGETAAAIGACMTIIMKALPEASLSPVEQLLWLIDRELEDDYSILEEVDDFLYESCYTIEHWMKVAGILEKRLADTSLQEPGQSMSRYHREQILDWLREAYRLSNQGDKIISLLEEETDRCMSYEKLVRALLESGMRDRARYWCIRGFEHTCREAPGIASNLHNALQRLAMDEGNFELATAYLAEDFFERPSLHTFTELGIAAEKAGNWPVIRRNVLDYLQTGKHPKSNSSTNDWPLPSPEVVRPKRHDTFSDINFPRLELFIEIALLEKRNDDAVELYQDLCKNKRWRRGVDEKLAQAVKKSHPEISLTIWQSIAEGLIAQVKPKAYEEAAAYLRYMYMTYEESGSLQKWNSYITALRGAHRAKRRLMEVLDGLGRNIKLTD